MSLIPRSFFFDDDFNDFFAPTIKKTDMKCDIYEENNEYHIVMDIPGFDKKDINIEVKDGYLTVKASKEVENKEENKNYIRRERSVGEFSRSFALGDVDEDNIKASFENGILNITLLKEEKIDTTKKIEIN